MKKLTLLILIIAFTVGCQSENDGTTYSLVAHTEPPVIIIEDPTADTPPPIIEPTADVPPPELEPDPTADTPPEPPPQPDPPPDVPPPPPPAVNPDFTVRIGNAVYFSDSVNMQLWKSGNIERAGTEIYAVGNDLITLDDSGGELSTVALTTPPIGATRTKIKATQNGAVYCIEYPPALAFSLGGMSSTYSGIYKDNAVTSPWYLNKFACDEVLSVGSEIFALDTASKYHHINGSSAVNYVLDNIFYRHDLNVGGKYFYINNGLEHYNLNYALNTSQWINYNGVNYSENGYTWDNGMGWVENNTVLNSFNIAPYPVTPLLPNAEAPTLLSAGISNSKLYWIECNSGWVFEYDPAIDTLTQKWKIYLGDGMRDTGNAKRGSLNPYIFGGKLYFSNDAAIYKLELATGFINIFYAGSGVVNGY